MANPILRIFEVNKPFIFFHTHVIDRKVLDAAVTAKKSLEVDISITDEGEIYVGHPLSHYRSAGLPPPNNLPLDVVLHEMKAAGLFLVLDCKDVKVLPKAREIIEDYGPDNALYHSWSDALTLNPYLKAWDTTQPNWPGEELPHTEILKLRQATGVPMTLSCHRGLTRERLNTDGDVIADRIAEILDGNAEGVSFTMPKDQLAPVKVMQKLLEHKILTNFSVDIVPPEERPSIYLGYSDYLELASDPKDFQ